MLKRRPAPRLAATFAERWPARHPGPFDERVGWLVIGSGYGGAIAAQRLVEAGQQVLVLERGSEFLPGEFANDVALLPKFLRAPALRGPGTMGSAHGLFEWHVGAQVVSLTANGLGGGSLINAGVALEPDDDVVRQPEWPAALRQESGDGAGTLRHAFARVRSDLGVHDWSGRTGFNKTRSLQRLAPLLQHGGTAAPVALTIDPAHCTACGDCCSGCNQPGAKLTLRDTCLAKAALAGAQIVCGAWAWRVEPLVALDAMDELPETAPRWRVTVLPTGRTATLGDPATVAASREARVVEARHVVLAAGTFGSTELLQRSRALAGEPAFALSPALGTRFSGNGDSLSFVVDLPQAVHAEGLGATAAAAPDGAAEAAAVGPTITAVVDLRQPAPDTQPASARPKPLEHRVVVEDGATPGAIVQAAREMLALQYTLEQMNHVLPRRPRAAVDMDVFSADAMGPNTQVLLAMGHDGALGRIVRLPERDRSVPWWPGNLAELPVYQAQQRHFDGLRDSGGVHLHVPTWQSLPRSATTLMSGPKPSPSMLTVHPLGGCPMADHHDHGVVDACGRVWAAPGRLWPGLMVLDGSIVPTSLGVNPLLTIAALADRAMHHVLAARADDTDGPAAVVRAPAASVASAAVAQRSAGGSVPARQPQPVAFQRPQPATFDVSLFERLTCPAGQLHGRQAAGRYAEARLTLGADDWMRVWSDPRHRVSLRHGHLRLQAPVAGPAMRTSGEAAATTPTPHTWHYRMMTGEFELLPQGSLLGWQAARRAGWLTGAEKLLRLLVLLPRISLTALTWLALRGVDDYRRHALAATGSPRRTGSAFDLAGRIGPWLVGMVHATESRRMRYRVGLQLQGPQPGNVPERLQLIGVKDVRYAATAWQLLRWWWTTRLARRLGHGVPGPRPSYWEQVTNPQLSLLPESAGTLRRWLAEQGWPRLAGAWAWGRFAIDSAELMAQAPLQLHRGELTGGLQAQAAYPMHFLRHALKTHLSDFRAPDYAAAAVDDSRYSSEGADALKPFGRPVRSTCHRLRVRRGRSEGEAPDAGLPNELELELWHHRRPDVPDGPPMLNRGQWCGQPVWRARSVLLVHAFGQSGAMFTLPAPMPSLARSLLEAGYDVWVLEHRISTRLPYTEWPSTIDQLARFDLPKAITTMIEQINRDHAAEIRRGGDTQVQVFAFAQCIGGAALAMALLDGRLSHGIEALLASGPPSPGPVPRMPQLAGAVISQTHPFLVGSPLTRAKTWVPHLLRNALGGGAVPLAVRSPAPGMAQAWLDRALATLPVPADEHCPHERDARRPQDDCATCRRIRFIEAPLFKHRNLGADVHARLPQLFGPANLHLFAHAARCVEHERLVDADGRSVYVRDDRWRAHLGLPLAFLHGQLNELFDVASARRSAAEHARLWPEMARRVAEGLGRPQAPLAEAAAWILPDHGHVDPVLGRHAPERVFAPMAVLFDSLWRPRDELQAAPAVQARCLAVPPQTGPWIGHVEWIDTRRLRVHLAFHVDDRWSGGRGGPGAPAGTRSWAFVRVGRGPAAGLHRLRLSAFNTRAEEALAPAGGSSPSGATTVVSMPGYRVAHGVVELEAPPDGQALRLRAFSVHEMLVAGHPATMPAGLLEAPEGWPTAAGNDAAAEPDGPAAPLPRSPAWEDWIRRLLVAGARSARHAARRRDWLDPAWRLVSRQAVERRHAWRHVARIDAAVWQALRDASASGSVCLAAASCRYPGMAVDAQRVDAAARALLQATLPATGGALQPAFAMLLGDQIYADATAGLVDSLNPVERYVQRHARAFSSGAPAGPGIERQGAAALGDLLAHVPTYLTQDDHELRDGWPGSGPLQKGLAQDRARERRLVRVALQAVQAFQRLHMPARVGQGGSYTFRQGPMRCFMLDTRTERRTGGLAAGATQTLAGDTWAALEAWWNDPAAANTLQVLASGSVLLPRLWPHGNPSDPGEDSLAWDPATRERLLGLLQRAAHAGRHFLLLSGDYHLCAALSIRHGARTVGAAVVVPPLYAPLLYTNAPPDALWADEDLSRHGLQLSLEAQWSGSGFAALQVRRNAAAGYDVTLAPTLCDHAQGGSTMAPAAALTITLD